MTRPVERLPGFPRCSLLALLDTEQDIQTALHALAPHLDRSVVRVLSGQSGVHALDVPGAAHGPAGRLRRALQNIAYARDSLAHHEAHLRRGGHLLVVPARDWAGCDQLVQALARAGAHGLVWFARHSVVDVTPRQRCVDTPAVLVGAAPLPIPAQRRPLAA